MSDTQHEPFDGLAALYAMGALDDDERSAFQTHLEVCLECVNEVKSLLPVTHGLLHCAPPLEAPSGLRARVIGQVTGIAPAERETQDTGSEGLDTLFATLDGAETAAPVVEPPARTGPGVLFWLAASLLVAAAGAGGWYISGLDRQIIGLRADLDAATRLVERSELDLAAVETSAAEREAVLAIVTGPDVQRLDLAGQPLAPRASARAMWNDAADMVFLVTGLPALPAGDVYQLWFVLPDAPVSAALVEPDPGGDATVLLVVPDSVTLPSVMAMTIEPEGGVDAPTGDVYLLGQPAE
jgi:anti-sigma factor ChrR (cupin superfamily)